MALVMESCWKLWTPKGTRSYSSGNWGIMILIALVQRKQKLHHYGVIKAIITMLTSLSLAPGWYKWHNNHSWWPVSYLFSVSQQFSSSVWTVFKLYFKEVNLLVVTMSWPETGRNQGLWTHDWELLVNIRLQMSADIVTIISKQKQNLTIESQYQTSVTLDLLTLKQLDSSTFLALPFTTHRTCLIGSGQMDSAFPSGCLMVLTSLECWGLYNCAPV